MRLIDKDAVVAEIERLKNSEPYYPTLAERYAYNNGVNDAIDKIYSLEVKEVDLEKDLELTWEDIRKIVIIYENVLNDKDFNTLPIKDGYTEILKRFNKERKKK